MVMHYAVFDKELEFRIEVVFYNAMEDLRPLSN
jgi:hypothetical protein